MGQISGPKMFDLLLYLHNAAPSTPIKCGSNGSAYDMRKNEREKGGKRGIKSKNKNPCAYIFNRDPCAMTFRECKILAVLDCEEQLTHLLSFSSKLCLISCLCWIPEVNIQSYPDCRCFFQNPRPF